jgi:hypothetical protein
MLPEVASTHSFEHDVCLLEELAAHLLVTSAVATDLIADVRNDRAAI